MFAVKVLVAVGFNVNDFDILCLVFKNMNNKDDIEILDVLYLRRFDLFVSEFCLHIVNCRKPGERWWSFVV